MPPVSFFARLGFFVHPHFLDHDTCMRIRLEMRASAGAPARVLREGGDLVDADVRRAISVVSSEGTAVQVGERLAALQPALERHFRLRLTECEVPQFLLYRPGDFFRPHRDGSEDPQATRLLRQRKLSVVIFLNNNVEGLAGGEDGYSGGALTFYEVFSDPRANSIGFPLTGETGLLVCFPASVLHEVAPVTGGERLTIVCWFY